MKWKRLAVWIFICVIAGLIILFFINSNILGHLKSDTHYVSLKDLSQNPSNYVGREITITGKLKISLGGYSLEDDNGYWVWIGNGVLGDGCLEAQRNYNYNSNTYSASGEWIAPLTCNSDIIFACSGFQYNYHLNCSSPLN